jgi:hypothetical protein
MAMRFFCLLLLIFCAAAPATAPFTSRIHAHNDYQHPRPLLDALDAGARSVEADIYLVNGVLLVAHSPGELNLKRSLESLYLDPLRQRIADHNGSVYGDGEALFLLIDIKTESSTTYPALRAALERYANLLTHYTPEKKTGPITVILTGHQPARSILTGEADRLAACDGAVKDLSTNPSLDLVPLISGSWETMFKWDGTGEMPDNERATISRIVQQAHEQHRTVRFWGGPDNENMWRQLQALDVDWINTDHLAEASAFLKQR